MPLPESIFTAPLADMDLQVVSGEWPAGISGEMFISAPVVDDRLSYQLFGFGAMLRISMTPGTHGAAPGHLPLRVRTIDTPVQRLHARAGEKFSGGLLGLVSPFGHANMANTAPLSWNGRLFATWDVGRPVEVDPLSLGFLGEVGSAASWGGDSFGAKKPLPQVFSTAHPVIDDERDCMWTVKLVLTAAGMQPHVVRYDGSGKEVRTWPVDGAIVVGSMHTIAQTRNWLVMADSGNFKADMNEIMGGERTLTVDERVPVYFVRKDAVESTPPGTPLPCERAVFGPTTGHYYANWDDSDGVRVLFEHLDLTDLGYRLLPGDVDAHGNPVNPAYLGFYQTAMCSQTVSEIVFRPGEGEGRTVARFNDGRTWNLQLSAMDWSREGRTSPTHHHVVYQGRHPELLARRVLHAYRDRIDEREVAGEEQGARLVTLSRDGLGMRSEHVFPSLGDLPSSPIFVPRPGGVPGGGDGHVVVPVLNDDGFRLECFDAADVSRGPVATARGTLRQRLPFILHAIWMPEAAPAPDVERLRFADDVPDSMMSSLDDAERDLVLAVAAELG
ncbi:MAG: carotenoid oxygenase [Actinobacteria bacterium]|jgi:all-trans-8'-apo-beta-carotenal 15,15'-oxygenase|nr:carotenoid oxygenase [Actinomycetota bacterium]